MGRVILAFAFVCLESVQSDSVELAEATSCFTVEAIKLQPAYLPFRIYILPSCKVW